jgi:phage head maturation protease
MKKAEKLVNLVACGQATVDQMDELGPELVANIKTAPQKLQVRSRGSDIITKNDEKRQISYLVSDETPDRVGDIIKVTGWDLAQYRQNPVILWAHDGSSVPPIGKADNVRRRYEGKPRLTADVEFAPKEAYEFADTIYQLASRGFIKATSVGFMPLETMDVDKKAREELGLGRYGQVFTKAELMEISIVSVPANPSALELGVKQLIKEGKIDKSIAPRFFDTYPKDELSLQKKIRAACRSFVDMGAAWDLHSKPHLLENEAPSSSEKDMKQEKSPACRQDGETTEECVTRKVPELIDEGMEQDQAVAVANSVCETACSEKDEEAPERKNVEKLTEALDMMMAAGSLIKQSIQEYSGYGPDEDEDMQMSASGSSEKAAEVLALSSLIEQQAEQTRATRQLVDSLTDLTKSIHGPLSDGSSGGSKPEPDAAKPDVVKEEVEDLEGILDSRLRGFADGLRRDLLTNKPQNRKS